MTMATILWTLLIFIICAYLGIILLMYFFQAKLLYKPTRNIVITPADFQLDYEDVYFTSKDNSKLHGWFIEAQNPKYTVLFCHGNKGNVGERADTLGFLYKLNLNTFLFDYRGYGKSEGKTSEIGTYEDAQAAWDYLINQKKLTQKNIIILGRSMGGPIAANLASKVQPKMVALETTFFSLGNLAQQLYPFLPVKYISRIKYNTQEYVKQINVPILIISSSTDELIPFNHGKELFEIANEPKEFQEIHGDHGNCVVISGEIYTKKWGEFIDRYK